jgi:hypothetical protein
MSSTLKWAVKREDGLFYNPNKPGDRRNPTFHKTPKLYKRLGDAEKAKTFCESGINNHWCPPSTFNPIPVTIVTFHEVLQQL